MILAVDLAARFSACTVMNRDREVIHQWDSIVYTPKSFALSIIREARLLRVNHIVIEDVPFGITNQSMIKPVLHLQGRIMQARDEAMMGYMCPPLLLTQPAYWLRYFHLFGSKPEDQLNCAREFGYEPPDVKALHADHIPAKGKERTKILATLRKAQTDYVASYLIARWAWDMAEKGDLSATPGIEVAA